MGSLCGEKCERWGGICDVMVENMRDREGENVSDGECEG